MHVNCPHCQNAIEIVDEASLHDIVCASCGSSFSLVADATATYASDEPKSLGHFELTEQLGVGAFGTVWKARDTKLDRIVAVKIPRKDQLSERDAEQFFREARAAAQVKHPNIVGVHEIGREGDSLYIVSDYVAGITLGDWLTGQRPSIQQSAELVIKIADALQVAHDAGIVHRDLKPSNIMLDEDGEPHVMDFGLAKREAGEITMTADGQVLGTPAYMSPEQARGDAHTADSRADIYAMGVILFELLTGERPFRGNQRMLLHQLLNEEAPSPRTLNSNVPKDLETITLKCLEKESARRFQRVGELAAELRSVQSGEPIKSRPVSAVERSWRWAKRNPAVATLSTSLLIALIAGLSAVTVLWMRAETHAEQEAVARHDAEQSQDLAEQQRELAQNNFQMARDAVDKYLTQVSEDERLKAQGLETLRQSLLETARDFYQSLLEKRPDDHSLLQDHAASYYRVGQISLTLAENDAAHRAFDAALDIRQKLTEAYPDNPDHHFSLAETLRQIGGVYRNKGDYQEAETALLDALEVSTSLVQATPTTHEHQSHLGNIYHALANLYYETDKENSAKRQYELALQTRSQLVSEHPDSSEYLEDLASTYNNLGILFLREGRYVDAESHYKQSQQIRKRLAEKHSGAPNHRNMLAQIHNNLGSLYRQSRKYESAELELQESLRIRSAISKEHPDVPAYRAEIARTHNNLGDLYRLTRRFQDAEAQYADALAILKHLAANYPHAAVYDSALASSLTKHGNRNREDGKRKDAEERYKQASEICRRLVAEHPEEPNYQRDLAATLNALARLYSDDKDTREDSEEHYKQAMEIRTRLSEEHPTVRAYRDSLASVHNSMAGLYYNMTRLKESESHYIQALDIRKQLIELYPSIFDYQQKQASTHRALGHLYRRIGTLDESRSQFRQSLQMRKVLAEQHPDSPTHQLILASAHSALADLYQRMGRLKESESQYIQALRIRKVLAERYPDSPTHQSHLANAHGVAAFYYKYVGKPDDAVSHWTRSLEIHKQLAEEHPDSSSYQGSLASDHQTLAIFYAEERDHESAETHFTAALDILTSLVQLAPHRYQHELALVHKSLGDLYRQAGTVTAAEHHVLESLGIHERMADEDPQVQEKIASDRVYLGRIYQQAGRFDAAEREYLLALHFFKETVSERPHVRWYQEVLARVHCLTAGLYRAMNRVEEAQQHATLALQIRQQQVAANPNLASSHSNFAWQLATSPEPAVRDGILAVKHATRACELSEWAVARHILTLAAAHAEMDDFDNATRYAKQAIDLNPASVEGQEILAHFQSSKPYRDLEPMW